MKKDKIREIEGGGEVHYRDASQNKCLLPDGAGGSIHRPGLLRGEPVDPAG